MDLNKWTTSMRDSEMSVEALMAAGEAILISVAGRVGLWLTPAPSAFLVARSASRVFSLDGVWPWIMAAIIELVGLATSHLWLTAREWNTKRNKTDPEANQRLALALMLSYFAVTGLLLLAFELPNTLATGNVTGLTALLFPCLSAVAVVALNERSLQHKRVSDKAASKLSRKVSSETVSFHTVNSDNEVSNIEKMNTRRAANRQARLDALATFYQVNPHAGVTEASRAVGVSRQTIYEYRTELESAGLLGHNGNGRG